MSRKYIAAGNWKMHTTPDEGLNLLNELAAGWSGGNVEMIVSPPYVHLATLAEAAKGTAVSVAAQNCHFADQGAYTGEVSPPMLASMGIPYVIIGHSERREYFHETNAILKDKVSAVLNHGLKCIFCCGEPLSIREHSTQAVYVEQQIQEGLFHVDDADIRNVVIAYEPVWAIGTGKTATPQQAQDMHAHIRALVANRYGAEAADNMTILYGGSVKPGNATDLFANPDVDGGLVGGASLKADSFIAIAEALDASR